MHPDNTNDDTDDQAKDKTAKQGSPERPRKMSGFVLFVFGSILFGVAFAVATIYHTVGDYTVARNWGIAALVAACVAIIAAYQHYIIAPAKTVKPVVNLPPEPPDRPWLAIDIVSAGGISFGANESASLPFKVTVSNSGRMPANKTTLSAEAICPKFGSEFFRAPIKRRDEICQEAVRHGGDQDCGTVFPAKDTELFITFG